MVQVHRLLDLQCCTSSCTWYTGCQTCNAAHRLAHGTQAVRPAMLHIALHVGACVAGSGTQLRCILFITHSYTMLTCPCIVLSTHWVTSSHRCSRGWEPCFSAFSSSHTPTQCPHACASSPARPLNHIVLHTHSFTRAQLEVTPQRFLHTTHPATVICTRPCAAPPTQTPTHPHKQRCTHTYTHTVCVELARTIYRYTRCIYGDFCRDLSHVRSFAAYSYKRFRSTCTYIVLRTGVRVAGSPALAHSLHHTPLHNAHMPVHCLEYTLGFVILHPGVRVARSGAPPWCSLAWAPRLRQDCACQCHCQRVWCALFEGVCSRDSVRHVRCVGAAGLALLCFVLGQY